MAAVDNESRVVRLKNGIRRRLLLARTLRVLQVGRDDGHLEIEIECDEEVDELIEVVGQFSLLVTHRAGVVDDPQHVDLVALSLPIRVDELAFDRREFMWIACRGAQREDGQRGQIV